MIKMRMILGTILIMLLAMSTGLMADGTEPTGNPRQVSTLDHLLWISTNSSSWGDGFIQTADIDASGTSSWNGGAGFSPIGNDGSSTRFTGEYDGDGHTIDNLYIHRSGTNWVGLFGYTNSLATISNLGVTNVNITASGYVGGLVGVNKSSTVSNSYSTGSVTCTGSSAGGLVGYNSSSTVSNSYSTGSVSGGSDVGGLVGHNRESSTVENSYSTGIVSGNSSVGGLVGYNSSSSTATNSFWDTETSEQSSSAGGTGKTTAEMKTLSTFTTAEWDFSSIWDRADNQNGGYPHLDWQTFPRTVTFTDGSSFSPSPTQGATDQAIGRFALKGDATGATFDGVWITLNGTRTGATNFKLWYSTDATYGSDTQLGSTVAADPGTGEKIWFTSLSNSIGTSDGYYFLSCDVAADATGSIQGVIVNDEDMMLGFSNSTTSSAKLSGSDASLPVELTSFTAENKNGGVLLKWSTGSEIENVGFILERRDSKIEIGNWEEISSYSTHKDLQGQGNVSYGTEYSYTDNTVTPGMTYEYRLSDVSYDGVIERHDIRKITVKMGTFKLYDPYPNPFNPITNICYQIKEQSFVKLTIYDINGRLVETLVNEQKDAGYYTVNWNADNVVSGIYFYGIKAGDFSSVKKCLVIK